MKSEWRSWMGGYAVFVFYVMSGYLMTMILQTRYGFSPRGLKAYALNRFLRIYPLYWLGLLMSAAIILTFDRGWIDVFNPSLRWPETMSQWLRNGLIFGLVPQTPVRMIPPGWALHVELCFYLLIALLLGRNRRTAFAWLVASCLITAYLVWNNAPFMPDRYSDLMAASLPFSVGTTIYFVRQDWPMRRVPILLALLGIAAFCVHVCLADVFWVELGMSGFYASLAIGAIVIYLCAHPNPRDYPRWLAAIDRVLGNLSYPMYLLHWHVAIVVTAMMPIQLASLADRLQKGWWIFGWTLPSLMLLSWVCVRLIEMPIERIRTKVRGVAR